MLITFVGTLTMPLQFAVLLGVVISILLLIGRQANNISLFELELVPQGYPIERPAPPRLTSNHITILYTYGNLFYAAAKTIEENLPAVENTKHAVVIFRLRGHEELGATMIGVFERYNRTLQDNQGQLMLEGVSKNMRKQLVNTGFLERIGPQNVFLMQPQIGLALNQAVQNAQTWLDESGRIGDLGNSKTVIPV